MTVKQTIPQPPRELNMTNIRTGWLYAQYAHGKNVPPWLHQLLAHVREQAGADRLPIVILSVSSQTENLVVLTLHDFLTWSQREPAVSAASTSSAPCSPARREA